MLLLLVSSVLSVSLYSVRFAAWYSLSQYIWSSSLLQGTCSQELRHSNTSDQQTCIIHEVHTIHTIIFTVWCSQSSRLMDKILRELNLGTLVDRFDAEKFEPDNVISASDSELTRLGVSTIGDRMALSAECAIALLSLRYPSIYHNIYPIFHKGSNQFVSHFKLR